MNSCQLINQDSGKVEYYSPWPVIAAAVATMGGIDLDPASSTTANMRVGAAKFYSKEEDGLKQEWFGRVWLNHPFSKEGNPLWITKLILEVDSGRVTQACCITYASTSEKWFQPLLEQPQCYLAPRTDFHLPDGSLKKGASKGCVVTYFGRRISSFRKAYQNLGAIKI